MPRKVELVIISDTHLGMFGCKAKELNMYLKSIETKHLILNGDIIDIWEFDKNYFPKTHSKVLKTILDKAAKGTKVTYITGNHDEVLRKFTDFKLGNFELLNKIVLELDGKKAWIFHGDVFDASIQNSKWLAKLGSFGYDLLIRFNFWLNIILDKLGKEKYSLSKKIKSSVKNALKYVSDFEETAAELAIENNYDYVICGHIHMPQIKEVTNTKGKTLYLNSGDWIENLTALEYHNEQWKLFTFNEKDFKNLPEETDDDDFSAEELIDTITRK